MLTQTLVKKSLAVTLLFALIAGCSCSNSSPQPAPANTASASSSAVSLNSKVGDIASEISKGVGSVQKSVASGATGPVFVFEEFHTSRIGQLQIAVMLFRLHERYGLKKVGLEGAINSGRPLDSSWFQRMGGNEAKEDREDLSVRWLAEGEIGSAEFLTLVSSDVKVYGIEAESEYKVQPPSKGPEAQYLLAIAEQTLTDEDKLKASELLQQDKKKEAFDYLMNADPWLKKRYEDLKKQSVKSAQQEIARLRELQSRAREVGARISSDAEANLEAELQFLRTADQRSSTMVDGVLGLPGAGTSEPLAMCIGAAHTERVVELLAQRNIGFAVIRPNDLNPKHGSITGEQFERKSGGKWARNSPGTLARLLNDSRKPAPVIERTTGHSYASMILAGMLIAKGGRGGSGGGRFPDNIWPVLSGLPDIRLDRDSFATDGYDVIYRAWLKQDNGGEKEVWARVGTLSNSPTARTIKTLEEKLLQACADLGGGSIIPPTDLPPKSQGADGEGPKDGKRQGLVISRTGRETLAVFAASQELVRGVGRISD